MTTEEALLAAIWAAPHDDLPRLVYADWLDESGDPAKAARAEFIRVQCELAKVGEFDDRTESLQEAEKRLLDEWRREWIPRQKLQNAGISFHRGMFHPGYSDLRQFRSEASLVRSVAPLYRLWLSSVDGLEPFLKWPPAEGLHHLGLFLWFAGWGKHIATSPLTRNLRHLNVGESSASPVDFDRLCRATHLVHLTELWFTRFEATAAVIDALLTAPFAPQLRRLALGGGGQVPSSAFARLLTEPVLTSLEQLSLHAGNHHYNWSDLLRRLADDGRFNGLKCLHLHGGFLSGSGCLELARWPGSRALHSLALHLNVEYVADAGTTLRLETLTTLLESDGLPRLRKLTASPVDYDRQVSQDPDGRLGKLYSLAQDRGVKLEFK